MLSSSFIWFFLFSSYNHTRRRPVRHAERSDGDVANRAPPGWDREWRETRGSSFIPYVACLTTSCHSHPASLSVGSSSLLSSLAPVGFTSLASGGMEWSVERRRTRNTTRQNDRRWRARMNRPGETEAGWSVSSLSLFPFPSRSPLCYSRRSCRHSLLTSLAPHSLRS